MRVIYLGWFLLGLASAQTWNVKLNTTKLQIHIGESVQVPFHIFWPTEFSEKSTITVINDNERVLTVENPILEFTTTDDHFWNDSIKITGKFLGKSEISLQINTTQDTYKSDALVVTVIRPERLIDKLFTISVATLVSILYINFGCAMDWEVCKETIKKPIGPLIGSLCQFIIMPLLAFGIGHAIFPSDPAMQIGIFFTGISPSGGASNIWTTLLGGNLPLSIGMTTVSTLASFATMPIWIFTLGKYIFDKGHHVVPYARIGEMAFGLIVPLLLGFFIQRKFPKVCRIMVRIMKPFSVILILFIVIFAIVTNLYLFELFSWQIVVAGMGLPWLGFMCGLTMMLIFRQPQADVRAIAIETGIQNTGIAIFLLRFSMEQPAADLTTVIPVACAIMTPIPLMILWAIKLIFDRRKKNSAASMEKLQGDGMPVVITNLSVVSA